MILIDLYIIAHMFQDRYFCDHINYGENGPWPGKGQLPMLSQAPRLFRVMISRKRLDLEDVFALKWLMIVARATRELRCLPIFFVSFCIITNHYHDRRKFRSQTSDNMDR